MAAAAIPNAARDARLVPAARLALILGTLAAFVGTLDNALITNWDDNRFLTDPDVVSPSLAGLVRIFTEVRFEAYHPLHLLSYWIDVPWVGSEGPIASATIHAVNLALWVGVVLVAFEVMRKLGLSTIAACLATLAFAIHPLSVEVVCWASARKDIVAIGLSLAATLANLSTDPRAAQPWRERNAWIAWGCFALAGLAKTSVLTLPLAWILLDVWTARRTLKAAALAQWPALLIGLGLGLGVIWIWYDNHIIRSTGTDAAAFNWILIPATITHFAESIVFPVHLSPMYALWRHQQLSVPFVLGTSALVFGMLLLCWRQRDTLVAARIGLGLSWFLVVALPVLNIIPIFFQWEDRYVVAPLFGIAFAFGALLDRLRTSQTRETFVRLAVTSAVVLAPLAWTTVQQVEVWRSADQLWATATRRHPRAAYAWVRLAEVRQRRGDLHRAVRAAAAAVDVAPELRLTHATMLLQLAYRDERDQHLSPSRAVEDSLRFYANADDAMALRTLSSDMVEAGYHDAALYPLARSLDIDPVSVERIERAVSVHLSNGNIWLARFYLSRMGRRPVLRDVTTFWEAERERLGLISDEEMESRADRERGSGPVVIPLGGPSEE